MKMLILFTLCYVTTLAVSSDISTYEEGVEADICTDKVCKAENGCRCATDLNPLESDELIPQLISLTFDEAVTDEIFKAYWQPLLYDRVNPDGQPISATFFVPHEYTDYEIVNDLYNHGFEIGVHSITNSHLAAYWPRASKELVEMEFGGQRHILSKFSNIPEEDIIGARYPGLQLAGNNTFSGYQAAGLQYDSSWPTLPEKRLFPYTLDYKSSQQCMLADRCPNEAFKGFWVLPINDLRGGYDDRECSNLIVCNVTGTSDEIAEWLLDEINKVATDSRVPLTLTVNSYWFEITENSLEGFTKFLDKLIGIEDIFLVSQKQVLDWMKKPVPLSQFRTDSSRRYAPCTPYSCKLKKPDGNERSMKSCAPCPANYPWLGNPDGN